MQRCDDYVLTCRLVLRGHCLERELIGVAALTSLTELDISSPACSEACTNSPEYLEGLIGLGCLTKMQRLSLARAHVTPAALSCIALNLQVSHSHNNMPPHAGTHSAEGVLIAKELLHQTCRAQWWATAI